MEFYLCAAGKYTEVICTIIKVERNNTCLLGSKKDAGDADVSPSVIDTVATTENIKLASLGKVVLITESSQLHSVDLRIF